MNLKKKVKGNFMNLKMKKDYERYQGGKSCFNKKIHVL